MRYRHEYDDPYKLLAYSLVVDYPVPTVMRIIKDPKFVRREIIREVRSNDLRGHFIDCLFVAICEDKDRMGLMRQLDSLGRFFYQRLDLPRLRQEIRNAYEELDIEEGLEALNKE